MKTVLVIAGVSKRRSVATGEGHNSANGSPTSASPRSTAVNPYETLRQEAVLVRQAIVSADMPKLVGADKATFSALLADMFPAPRVRGGFGELAGFSTSPLPTTVLDDLARAADAHTQDDAAQPVPLSPGLLTAANVAEACHELELQATDQFVQLVMRGSRLLTARQALFVLGPARAGKSTVLQTMAKAHGIAGRRVDLARLHVKPVPAAMLYGRSSVGVGGDEPMWHDGVLSRTLREQSLAADDRLQWMVLDGVVDPGWVESLNSVMDDNRVLTLASNERILLKDNMRVVLEAADLCQATPATVSRAAVLFVGCEQLGWRTKLSAWLAKQGRQPLREVATRYVQAAVSFLTSQDGAASTTGLDAACNIATVVLVERILHLFDACVSFDRAQACYISAAESSVSAENASATNVYFAFATVWGVGGPLQPSERQRFDEYLRQHVRHFPFPNRTAAGAPATGFDWAIAPASVAASDGMGAGAGASVHGADDAHVVNVKLVPWDTVVAGSPLGFGLGWQQGWQEQRDVAGAKLPPFTSVPNFASLFVPCGSVSSTTYILGRLTAYQANSMVSASTRSQRPRPVLLTGACGSGKTVLMRATIAAMSELAEASPPPGAQGQPVASRVTLQQAAAGLRRRGDVLGVDTGYVSAEGMVATAGHQMYALEPIGAAVSAADTTGVGGTMEGVVLACHGHSTASSLQARITEVMQRASTQTLEPHDEVGALIAIVEDINLGQVCCTVLTRFVGSSAILHA